MFDQNGMEGIKGINWCLIETNLAQYMAFVVNLRPLLLSLVIDGLMLLCCFQSSISRRVSESFVIASYSVFSFSIVID